MNSLINKSSATPWYREPWPWLLMAGPAIVIVAGVITAWLAFSTSDGLVDDDYYKQGLAVNQRIHRDREALERDMSAKISLATDGKALLVTLSQRGIGSLAPALTVRFSHPTVAGRDIDLTVLLGADGNYHTTLDKPLSGRWFILLEDASLTWRLLAEWNPEQEAVIELVPNVSVSGK